MIINTEFEDIRNNTTLAQRIRRVRKNKFMSIEVMSERFSKPVPVSLISYWENGKREPNLERLKELAVILEVPLLWLIYGNDNIDPSSAFSYVFKTLISEEMLAKEPINSDTATNIEDLADALLGQIDREIDKFKWIENKYPGYPGPIDYIKGYPKYPGYPSEDYDESKLEYEEQNHND